MRRSVPPVSVAVVAHVFYEDMWPELAACLRQLASEFTLYVTIPDTSDAEGRILRDFPAAIVRRVPNRGRDIAPLISLLPDLQRFDAVCKIHTKRNLRTSAWRVALLKGVLRDKRQTARIVEAFAAEPELVLAGSRLLYVDGHKHLAGMRPLLERYGGDLPERFGFFAGTMFWMRPSAFADFADLFPQSDFVAHTEKDLHPEHAAERLFGLRAAKQGAKVGLTDTDWLGRSRLTIAPATTPGAATLSLKALDRRYGRKENRRKRAYLPALFRP
jgi:lipopolysaccharide biosynthesis protein